MKDISHKMKCITEAMADEKEAYEFYKEYAEVYHDCPAIHDLFTKHAEDEKRHFDELYKLLNEYMEDLKNEMMMLEPKPIPATLHRRG